MALAQCRESCSKALQGRPELPWMVEKYGGLANIVTDPFGFNRSMCGIPGGLTSSQRNTILYKTVNNNEQPEWVPAFTETGFWKTKVPPSLWKKLSESYKTRLGQPRLIEIC